MRIPTSKSNTCMSDLKHLDEFYYSAYALILPVMLIAVVIYGDHKDDIVMTMVDKPVVRTSNS